MVRISKFNLDFKYDRSYNKRQKAKQSLGKSQILYWWTSSRKDHCRDA